jgi:hypothetical protein
LFSKMYDSNPDNRELNIYELLDEYESILLGTGVLTRLGKRFDDNELVESAPMPSPLMRKAKKEDKHGISSKPLSEELEKIAYLDAVPAKASATKVTLKPTAKVSATKVTLKSSTATKVCPPGKELNPKTGRCIKQCAPDETRNAQGRCVKKTRRHISRSTSTSRSSTSRSSTSRSKTRSQTSRNRHIKENLLNDIFPELKKITPFTEVKAEAKDANPTIKINKTFPYENRSKTNSKS